MAQKFAGYLAQQAAIITRIKDLHKLGKEVTEQGGASKTNLFKGKYKMLKSWVDEHEKLVVQILQCDKKVDFVAEDFHKQLIEVDNMVVESRLFYEILVPTVEVEKEDNRKDIPVKLPSITLPTFTGISSEWMSFIAMFKSLVLENGNLTQVEKFQYLRSSLKGEPLELVRGLDITGDNLPIAVHLLTDRYDNLRKLATLHADKIINIQPATAPSAKYIRNLISCYRENVEALRNLNVINSDINGTSDGFFLFLTLSRKLDPVTRGNFERSLASNKTVPSPDELICFLEKECCALEASGEMKGSQTRRIDGGRSVSLATEVEKCPACNKIAEHRLHKCNVFLRKTPSERKDVIQSNRLCFNCLGDHLASACTNEYRCKECKMKHHTLLHFRSNRDQQYRKGVKKERAKPKPRENSDSQSEEVDENEQAASVSCHSSRPSNTNVILSTVLLNVRNKYGGMEKVRALLDSGSQACYITTHCIQRLQLPVEKTSMQAVGLSGNNIKVNGKTLLPLHSAEGEKLMTVPSLIVSKITGKLPTLAVPSDIRKSLGNITLADPNFDHPGHIDCLLGADVFARCIRAGRLELGKDLPVVLQTLFGWVVMGSVETKPVSIAESFVVTFHSSVMDSSLDDALKNFGKIEEPIISISHSVQDQKVEAHFQETHRRDENGQYVVRLPFKDIGLKLGNSHLPNPDFYHWSGNY